MDVIQKNNAKLPPLICTASDDAERKARMLALSLDPCVACEVVLKSLDH